MPLDFELGAGPAVLAALGLVALGMALLPRLLHQRPLSFPLIYVVAGWLIAELPYPLPVMDPLRHGEVATHLTEIGVIVALFAVGLKIGRPLAHPGWRSTWRLLAIAMPAMIAVVTALTMWLLDFGWATALLAGAVLAPTDPVLASDVQQQSPHDEGPGEVRFALTSEAGLNDALAFPFTMAALAVATSGPEPGNWLGTWLAVDVGYRLAVGLLLGWLAGRVLRKVIFDVPIPTGRLAETGEGLIAIAGTFLTYGVTELAEGYGFLAVFVAAYTLRAYEKDHEYHDVIHDFSEQIEHLVNGVILVLLGAAVGDGILSALTWPAVLLAVAFVLVVRPITALAALGGPGRGRGITAFFGIRGVGSLFYLAYAGTHADFADIELVWSMVTLTVLLSIAVHGITAGPIMRRYDEADDVSAPASA